MVRNIQLWDVQILALNFDEETMQDDDSCEYPIVAAIYNN